MHPPPLSSYIFPSRTIFNIRAIIQFNLSDKYKDLVLNKHKIANCAECSTIMLGELSKKYLNMTVELISNPQANHAFNLINRDQSTSIFKPEEWNEDVLVVDAWLRTVHTKKEFIFENFRLNDYNLGVNTAVIIIRDLCINRNNHQQPTFHPLGD
jgi:hypothetical protein